MGRMPAPLRLASKVLPLVVLLAACGTDGGDGSEPPRQQVPNGAALYESSCASCHGVDLRGTALGPPHLSIVYEAGHHSDDSFRAAVANGASQHHWEFGPMAPVAGLDSSEVDAIINYIRATQQSEGFEPYPPG